MDHSYSTERERLQKSDHSYFTIAKKTPQVVLRKAQLLKEQTQDSGTSAVGQDHSYVRADHVLHFACEDDRQVDDALCSTPTDERMHCQKITDPPKVYEYEIRSTEYQSRPCNSGCLEIPSTAPNEADVEIHRRSDLDDLRCWIGCIQLDHAYDGPGARGDVGSVGSRYHLDHAYNCPDSPSDDVGKSRCPRENSDHAYDGRGSSGGSDNESSSSQDCRLIPDAFSRTSDHMYNCADVDPCECRTVGGQRWDHAYNLRYGSGTSLSDSSCSSSHHLDHSYDTNTRTDIGSNWDHEYVGLASPNETLAKTWQPMNAPRWSSSDDIRQPSRVSSAEPHAESLSISVHLLAS